MKKLLLLTALSASLFAQAQNEQVTIENVVYDINTLVDRELGPGVRYTRLRLPDYPLNINMLRIDVSNPYNRVETTQASDKLYGTESLVNAAKRQSSPGHVALAGANANFWCVSGQPPFSSQLIGVTYNGNLRNGKIITETNMYNDQWNGGYKHTGIVGVTPDGTALSGHFTWKGYINSTATGQTEIISVNKLCRDEELSAYNSYYGTTRTFRCVNQVATSSGQQTFEIVPNCATEVYMTLDPGQQWSAGDRMTFTVDKIATNAGDGTVGSYDLVLVGRGSKKDLLAKLAPGDKVDVEYSWLTLGGDKVKFDNLVGGNAQVMVNGELTKFNTSENYNSQIYSRTGYGVSADGKTLYMMVIDKSTDPVYGISKGCSTSVMCAIAKHYGVWHMTNFDAGGSAEMLVGNAIINKTTEGTPRAVANGMIVYCTAPEDNVISRLEFADNVLQAPIYASYRPRIIGYNQYGAIVSEDVEGITLSCPEQAGSCEGNLFTAGNTAGVYPLTASLGEVSVSKDIKIVESPVTIRLKEILIDNAREYPIEVFAKIDGNRYSYDPATIEWTVDDSSVAYVDENGVLHGLKNGTTMITGKIGDLSDKTTVTVEIPESRRIPAVTEDIANWTTGGSGTKNRSLARAGKYGVTATYTVSNTRSCYVLIKPSAATTMYALPDSLRIVFNPGDANISKIRLQLGLHGERPTDVYYENLDLKANAYNILEVPMSDFVDVTDLISYPIQFTAIGIYPADPVGTTSTISIPDIDGVYTAVDPTQGIDDIKVDDSSDANTPTLYYNLQGVRIESGSLTPGLYIRVRGSKTDKILVR